MHARKSLHFWNGPLNAILVRAQKKKRVVEKVLIFLEKNEVIMNGMLTNI